MSVVWVLLTSVPGWQSAFISSWRPTSPSCHSSCWSETTEEDERRVLSSEPVRGHRHKMKKMQNIQKYGCRTHRLLILRYGKSWAVSFRRSFKVFLWELAACSLILRPILKLLNTTKGHVNEWMNQWCVYIHNLAKYAFFSDSSRSPNTWATVQFSCLNFSRQQLYQN